jgi:predicted Zn-dependent protease
MLKYFFIFGFICLLTACSTSPTGRSQLLLYSEDKIDVMGNDAFAALKKEEPQSTDPKINAYVDCVANDTLSGLQNQALEKNWEVVVFENEEPNAFALPGKKIGVYTGMLTVAKNQDQLATVIGHEIAHVIAHHSNERASQHMATQIGLGVASVSGASADVQAILGMGTQYGILLPYSRGQESEADLIGLEIMAKAGFNPRASVDLWKNMASVNPKQPSEFLMTHPGHDTRIQDLNAAMPHAIALYETAQANGIRPRCD